MCPIISMILCNIKSLPCCVILGNFYNLLHNFTDMLYNFNDMIYSRTANKKRILVELLYVNIKVALAKWLQKHSFDTESTIRLLATDDQHAKDGICGKSGIVVFLV